MSRVIGIDVGSTNCVLAVADVAAGQTRHHAVRIIEIDGRRETPCVIALGTDQQIVVGHEARALDAGGAPTLPLDLSKLAEDHRYRLGYFELSMSDILGAILAFLKRKAMESLGDSVAGAVITHPVWLAQTALDALRVVCEELGGIPVLAMLPDAVAAMRALLIEGTLETGRTLVCDFGGRSCTAALLDAADSTFCVAGSKADVNLGGADIDRRVTQYFMERSGPPRVLRAMHSHPGFLRCIFHAAERAKCDLSRQRKASVRPGRVLAADDVRKVDIDCPITRGTMDQMIEPLVSRAIELSKACLADKGLTFKDLSNVVAVGGSSSIPVVRERLEQASGRPLVRSEYAPGCVAAVGAALHAATLRSAADASASTASRRQAVSRPEGSQERLLCDLRERFRQIRVEFHRLLQESYSRQPAESSRYEWFAIKAEALERDVKALFDRMPHDLAQIARQLDLFEAHLSRWPRPIEWQPSRETVLDLLAELENWLYRARQHLPNEEVRGYADRVERIRRTAGDAYAACDTATWNDVVQSALQLRSHFSSMTASLRTSGPPAPAILEQLLERISVLHAVIQERGLEPMFNEALQRAEAAARGVDLSDEGHASQVLFGIYKQHLEPVEGRLQEMAKPSESMPAAVIDRVHFSVTTVCEMVPERTYPLDVWAHLKRERKEVLETARAEAPEGQKVQIRTRGPVKVTRGAVLTVTVRIAGWTIDPQQDTIEWEGEAGNAQFTVTVPKEAAVGDHCGVAAIHIDGLKVVRLSFVVQVGAGNDAKQTLPTEARKFRSAFASYASADRDAVLARVQGMRKVAPEMDIFVDVVSLHSGQKWNERLEREILSRDVLYLFWSKAASQSDWVQREWEFALEERGIDFIDPVPLVSPEVVPPPKRLGEILHFNDWMLAYMRNQTESCK